MTGASHATQDGTDDGVPGWDALDGARVYPMQPRAGEYAVDGLDGVRWRIEKTVIRDAQGNAVPTIG
ncbi:aminopeptidase [Burkholderia lata]|uniref:hypothetical protein n=1 Tax=Burkholderia lata (strain ATCC 17760 / DSM 23089 / LMG 22485 / NCIMB 9086 / R18194 / 383) TaxID=482957 RepID=UPI001453B223|nr:hypothetical protein [Burkholderia lata]VWD16827.1 aminopeptidase [Burkholderia lata]